MPLGVTISAQNHPFGALSYKLHHKEETQEKKKSELSRQKKSKIKASYVVSFKKLRSCHSMSSLGMLLEHGVDGKCWRSQGPATLSSAYGTLLRSYGLY